MKRYPVLTILLYLFTHLALADINAANQALKAGNFAKAVEEFKKLADQGDVKAQSHLGYMYYVGEGVPQNYAEAVKWYRKAAVQGDKDAQYNLAVSYAFGEGTDQDFKEAVIWYRRAAEQGHAISQYSLGVSYAYGEGVEQDDKQAAEWFLKSAEQGYERAQVLLGSKFHTGDGIPKNYEKAAYWYRKAADRGNASAQYNLGTLYRAGKGVAQDYDQAIRWFRMSADQGYAAAQNELQSMERAIAGATREVSKPDTTPDTEQAATAQAGVTSTETSTGDQSKESKTSLVTLQKDSLLQLEPAEEKSDLAANAQTSTQVSAEEKKSAEKAEASITNDTGEDKPGFFSRLFGSGDDKKDQTALEKEETVATAYKDLASKQPPQQEKLTTAEKQRDKISDADKSRNESTTPGNAITNLWARPSIKQPAIENTGSYTEAKTDKKERPVVETKKIETPYVPAAEPLKPQEQITAAPAINPGTKKVPAEPLTSEDAPVIEEDEAIQVKPEIAGKKPVEIKPVESPYQPVEQQPLDHENIVESPDKVETKAESGGVFGFFSKFFSSDDEQVDKPAGSPEAISDETVDVETVNTGTKTAPADIEESVVKSYAEGTAPADQQLSTVKEDTIAKLDADINTRLPAESLETTEWDSQLIESTEEPPANTEQPGQLSEHDNRGDDQSGNLFNLFDGFFGDEQQQPVAEQEGDVNVDAGSESETGESIVQAMVDTTGEIPVEQAAENALETDSLAVPKQGMDTESGFSGSSFETIQTLAVKGNSDAQYELGKFYYSGTGTRQNYSQAFLWYRRAALQGNTEAQYSLGNMYLMGEGISQSDTDAIEWYSLAAQQGHYAAQNNLVNLQRITKNSEGEDPEKNLANEENAVNVQEDEPEEQPAPAESDYERGVAYSYGEGVIQNHETAFQYFKKSAELGYAPAQYKLGVAYAYGEGVEKDIEQAKSWYKKSAEQGYSIAQRSLGNMYSNGDGIEQNKPLGLAWYSILAEQGNVMDIHRRDTLKKELSKSEIEEAERLKQQLSSNIKISGTPSS